MRKGMRYSLSTPRLAEDGYQPGAGNLRRGDLWLFAVKQLGFA